MNIDGLACFGGFGCGSEALLAALDQAGCGDTPVQSGPALPPVDTARLAGYFSARTLRQCDHFTRMALLGACLALADAGLAPGKPGDQQSLDTWGLVLASGYGPAAPTFDFLDSLLEFGEQMASPLAFSHSVHNIPTAVVAKILYLAGPCCTVCQGESSVASGLLTARGWLAEGRVKHVLFGAVDEITPVLLAATERLLADKPAPAGCGTSRRHRPLGEGAVFLCLSRAATRGARGRIGAIELLSTPSTAGLVFPRPATPELTLISGAVAPDIRQAWRGMDCSPAYGNLPVAQAFDLAAALALLARATDGRSRAACLSRSADAQALIRIARVADADR